MDNKMELYRKKATEWVQTYRVNSIDFEHVVNIVSSVMMTRDGYLRGGSFVQAVIDNDLYQAINRGDESCLRNLKVIVAAKEYCHLY